MTMWTALGRAVAAAALVLCAATARPNPPIRVRCRAICCSATACCSASAPRDQRKGTENRRSWRLSATFRAGWGSFAFPARLEVALARRLPNLKVSVVTDIRPPDRERKWLTLLKIGDPTEAQFSDLANRNVRCCARNRPGRFRAAVSEGVEKLQSAGVDVVLMNMQYSPRTDSDCGPGRLCRRHALGGARARGAGVRSACDHAALVRRRAIQSLCCDQGHENGQERA